VEKRESIDEPFREIPGSFVQGNGTVAYLCRYSYSDPKPMTRKAYYRLRQLTLDGVENYSRVLTVAPDARSAGGRGAEQEFALSQNYPNPFNPQTEIRFSVPAPEQTTLLVYNMLGQVVATLFDGVAEPGQEYAVRFDGSDLASGTYFCRLTSGSQTSMRRLSLLK
jgi:hypothetical protein